MAATARAGGLSASAAFSKAATAVLNRWSLRSPFRKRPGLPARCAGWTGWTSNTWQSASTSFRVEQLRRQPVASSIIIRYCRKRAGTFTIPALQIDAGEGKTVSTQPVTLNVVNGGQAPAKPLPGAQAAAKRPASRPASRKPSAAARPTREQVVFRGVGHACHARLRRPVHPDRIQVVCRFQDNVWSPRALSFIYHRGRVHGGTDFRRRNPSTKVGKGGRNYDLVVFKTAITPVKAGTMTLPATDVIVRRNRAASLKPARCLQTTFFNRLLDIRQEVAAHAEPTRF